MREERKEKEVAKPVYTKSFYSPKIIQQYWPIPELRRTPQANQIAAVRFKLSSSFGSAGSEEYLPKGENLSNRYKHTAITLFNHNIRLLKINQMLLHIKDVKNGTCYHCPMVDIKMVKSSLYLLQYSSMTKEVQFWLSDYLVSDKMASRSHISRPIASPMQGNAR